MSPLPSNSHYTTLHYTTLHYTTLHSSTPLSSPPHSTLPIRTALPHTTPLHTTSHSFEQETMWYDIRYLWAMSVLSVRLSVVCWVHAILLHSYYIFYHKLTLTPINCNTSSLIRFNKHYTPISISISTQPSTSTTGQAVLSVPVSSYRSNVRSGQGAMSGLEEFTMRTISWSNNSHLRHRKVMRIWWNKQRVDDEMLVWLIMIWYDVCLGGTPLLALEERKGKLRAVEGDDMRVIIEVCIHQCTND